MEVSALMLFKGHAETLVERKSFFTVKALNTKALTRILKKTEITLSVTKYKINTLSVTKYNINTLCVQEHKIFLHEHLLEERLDRNKLNTSSAMKNANNASISSVGFISSPNLQGIVSI